MDGFITMKEAAELLGISSKSIKRTLENAGIETIKFGRNRVAKTKDVNDFALTYDVKTVGENGDNQFTKIWLTIDEAEKLTKKHRTTIQGWVKWGEVKTNEDGLINRPSLVERNNKKRISNTIRIQDMTVTNNEYSDNVSSLEERLMNCTTYLYIDSQGNQRVVERG